MRSLIKFTLCAAVIEADLEKRSSVVCLHIKSLSFVLWKQKSPHLTFTLFEKMFERGVPSKNLFQFEVNSFMHFKFSNRFCFEHWICLLIVFFIISFKCDSDEITKHFCDWTTIWLFLLCLVRSNTINPWFVSAFTSAKILNLMTDESFHCHAKGCYRSCSLPWIMCELKSFCLL